MTKVKVDKSGKAVDREKIVQDTVNIPKVLRELKTWCGYFANADGTINKKPISLVDYKGVGTKNKDRLVDFETAVKAGLSTLFKTLFCRTLIFYIPQG